MNIYGREGRNLLLRGRRGIRDECQSVHHSCLCHFGGKADITCCCSYTAHVVNTGQNGFKQ
jgi:hypothetical protein